MSSVQFILFLICLVLALVSLFIVAIAILLMADGYSPAKVIKALRDYLSSRGDK
jgi:hypothetical protein